MIILPFPPSGQYLSFLHSREDLTVEEFIPKFSIEALDVSVLPWENGYIESFNGKLRDELLDGEIFTTLQEARVLTKWWRWQYNHIRPHSSLGYRPPVPEAVTKPLTEATS